MKELSKNQEQMLKEVKKGELCYTYRWFIRTSRALIDKGLIKHKPFVAPYYFITQKGNIILKEIEKEKVYANYR